MQALNTALGDGRFDPDDVDEVLGLAFAVADLATPEMLIRFRRPATILWTAAVVGVALRDVGQLAAGGQVSVLGVGVEARARIRDMPSVSAMPSPVRQEYLQQVSDFDGTALTFDHAMDYLVGIGIGPMMADHVPELASVLDRLHVATGISTGNIVTFGIQGALGGPVTETEPYVELKTFVRKAVDEVIREQVFTAFDRVAGGNPDAKLYMDEVARPSIKLMVSFVFDQLDVVVGDPSVLGGLDYLTTLHSGLSALLYKIVARNLVVIEQIAADTVREQAVGAFGLLEQKVRSDAGHALMVTTTDHIDTVLANLSDYVPLLPGATGLDDEQLAAIQTFAAEMLSIAQEALGDNVFTNARWNRRRQALLALLLSLDDHFDWGSDDLIAEAIDTLKSCAFVPDEQALEDLRVLIRTASELAVAAAETLAVALDVAIDNIVGLESVVTGVAPGELVVAGSGGGFESDAATAFEAGLVDAIAALFIPVDGSAPDAGLTIVVPSPQGGLTAIGPHDVVAAVADAVLQLLDPLPLVGPRLEEAYQRAQRNTDRRAQPGTA